MCVLLQAALRWPSRLVCSARPSHTVNLVGPTRPPVSLPMRAITALPAGLLALTRWLAAPPPDGQPWAYSGLLPPALERTRAHSHGTWHLGILLGVPEQDFDSVFQCDTYAKKAHEPASHTQT